ncbi:type VI secretion system baseplate subunit TssF [Pseudomonas aeruginosa]
MRCALVIPTRNAGAHLDRLLPALVAQRRQPDSILVVDSRSSDDTVERFRAFGARVEVIEPASFNHGGTRRWASQQVEADALIYLTQDAIPASPDSFANLLDELYAEADIGVAYGRQLPHPGAGLLGAQARRFNYPPESRSKRLADASELGIKTCFSSDSFSAYRSDALAAVGGFPEDVIGSEDAYVAARLLQAGYAVRYAASAQSQPRLDGQSRWRLVSQLTLNHLSLVEGPRALEALREILALHNLRDDASARRQIEGLRQLDCQRVVAHVGEDAWRGWRNGLEIRLRLDPQHFVGASGVLFSAVLAQFFSLYATANRFVRTVLVEADKEVKTWQPQAGSPLSL